MERFTECFSSLVDPRKNQAQHDLTEMLFVALLATLSGATTCCDIELFGRAKEALLRTVLVLEHGIPSHDTFSRVFRILDPDSLEKIFRRFTKAFATTAKIKGVVAIDGKALRRAYERGQSHMPPVMVTAWSAMTRMALANVRAPGNNEAAGALLLIELLQLKDCVVTADALHCHRGMAKAIVERGGDYVLAVKNNQPGLLRDAKAAISAAERKKAKRAATKDADHGRKEARSAIVATVSDMAEKHDFPGLKAVARITSKRGSDKTVQRYFLLSQHYKPADCCASFASIGASKTCCIGRSTSFSTRIRREVEKTTLPPTSPLCADLPSILLALIPIQRHPCEANSNALPGTTILVDMLLNMR